MSGRLATPIPKSMRTRPRDARGYPVPFIVLVDASGRPQFTINDVRQTEEARRKRLCSICGKRLEREVWFIGGSRCFLHEHGAFVDGPVHYDCGHYAIRVCPFLAMSNYAKRIDDKLLRPGHEPDGMVIARLGYMLPNQPERFGFGCTSNYEAFQSEAQGWLYRARSWDYVSWWRGGIEINAPDAAPDDQPIVPGGRMR